MTTTRYRHALLRRPGANFADGITTAGLGRPDFALALRQHQAYEQALRQLGLEVRVLEADPRFPDGCFVEDTAIVTERVAVLARPGDPSRLGEQEAILPHLLDASLPIERVQAPARLDGGDVMRVGDHFHIGLSGRTDAEGARQLAEILARHGYTSSTVEVRGVLHLKTGVTHLGGRDFIGLDSFAPQLAHERFVRLAPGEEYAANTLEVNGTCLIPKGFPQARQALEALGLDLLEIEMSEFRKMDGGLTCLSLLF